MSEQATVLRVEPGDIVVITCSEPMTIAAIEGVRASAKERFPDNEVVILSRGLAIGALSRDEVREMIREAVA